MKNYTSVSFYIVAHQDDWQLFMTPSAYWDLNNPTTKVVFVYTTAGDAGKDSTYWTAREKGALRSAQFALDTSFSAPEKAISGQKTFLGHTVFYVEYKKSISYFLRLPDGRMTGKGSLVYAEASLTKLHKSHIQSVSAVDSSTTYQGWEDFCQTLGAIIQAEAKGTRAVWLNASDFMVSKNFADNADHTATGLAVKHTIDLLGGKYPLTLFRDYDVDMFPRNLSTVEVVWKTSLFIAYDVTVQAEIGHCTRCEFPFYMNWCLRQYSRQLHHESSLISYGSYRWGILLQAYANLRHALGTRREGLTRH
ncbi:MAG TPA: hypothetical protein VMT24_12340 [Aggregatilineaceae bacterium]|nr:hypothetical protein [Aggregatilineaceae bacterium]